MHIRTRTSFANLRELYEYYRWPLRSLVCP
jgi:hypothetical protein